MTADEWHRTALAMRDAAIFAQRERDACFHLNNIQAIYFNAALKGEVTEEYEPTKDYRRG